MLIVGKIDKMAPTSPLIPSVEADETIKHTKGIFMENKKEQSKKAAPARRKSACESCMYYDADNDDCRIELDEDELLRFAFRRTGDCPYYKFYDEYKSVQKQN